MSTVTLGTKLTTEVLDVDVDFLSRLVDGETVVTAASAIAVFSGVDSAAGSMLSGTPTITNSVVTQRIIDGVAGVVYILAVSVRTSDGNIYVNEGKLAVLPSNANVPAAA